MRDEQVLSQDILTQIALALQPFEVIKAEAVFNHPFPCSSSYP